MRLLCLSNGHGEDAIALQILRELQQHPNCPEIVALPIVGEGGAYRNIPLLGPVKAMPSGGFVYMDGWQFVKDVHEGLLQLTLAQVRAIRNWAKQGDFVLAVGDLVPLLFAWVTGLPYAFIGTAKSEYYLRDEEGPLPRESWWQQWEGWSGSVYHPWERWLMSHPRCKAVFPRDGLTTQILQQFSIPAFNLGNPMMDSLEIMAPELRDLPLAAGRTLTILLLPGSRPPEAYANWQQILQAVSSVIRSFPDQPLTFLGALTSGLDLSLMQKPLAMQGWHPSVATASQPTFTHDRAMLILSQQSFPIFCHQSDFAIAMAGTATEQFVGLGKPAIALPGQGPQFTPRFAEAQGRLLGPSLTVVAQPEAVGEVMRSLLDNPTRLKQIAENGHRRMGTPGAASRIANHLIKLFHNEQPKPLAQRH